MFTESEMIDDKQLFDTYHDSYKYHLELLSPVALGAVPLHDGLPQIQQEYISIVEAFP